MTQLNSEYSVRNVRSTAGSACVWFAIFFLARAFLPAAQAQDTNNAIKPWLNINDVHVRWGNSLSEELKDSALKGDPNAMFACWVMEDPSTELKPENTEALQWLRKAAEAEHSEAQVFLGYSFENARPSDMAQAAHWYRLSAAQNHSGGEYRLALCCLKGKGVEKDEERGVELLRQSADQGHKFALAELAEVYFRGIGQPRNEKDRPIKLLERSARKGFPNACSQLVFRYRRGLGTRPDWVAAAKWYCYGAVAFSYSFPLEGKILDGSPGGAEPGTPFAETFSLFLKAVKHKDVEAMTRIGQMYAAGKEVPEDAATAWQWFNLAVAQGSSGAVPGRAETERRMTSAELDAVKSSAGAFATELSNLSGKLPVRDLTGP